MVVGLGTSDIQRTKLYKDNPSAKPGQIPNTFGMLIQKSDNMPENIKEFDTLFAVDDKLINTHVEMSNILEEYNVGDTVTLSIIRNRRFIKLDITLKIFEVPVEKMYKR
jgi:S1-C subfamily serine protease